jgi:tRNA U54 and U55 pseudouridine synthase Pus10
MLGRGRPFMFEVTNPRRTKFTEEEMAALTERINASANDRVRVRDLQAVDK